MKSFKKAALKAHVERCEMINVPADVSNKSVVVTGASGTHGRVIALAFAKAGANVTLAARNLQQLQELGEEIQQMTGQIPYIYGLDISQEDEVEECFGKVLRRYGTLDVVINGAAQSQIKNSLTVTKKEMQSLLLVNLTGTFFCCREAGEIMKEQGGGKIINVVCMEETNDVPYTAGTYASKSGVIGLTKALAREWDPFRIALNALVIGKSASFLLEERPDDIPQDIRESLPKELGALCVHFASETSHFLTGRIIFADFLQC